jgi:hypothetical protein
MTRLLRILLLIFWLELGLALLLVPWSDFWEINFFLYQYPALALLVKNAFFRGAVSGLGLMDIYLALEAFRYRSQPLGPRT